MYASVWHAAQLPSTLSRPGPGLSLISCSCASAEPARRTVANTIAIVRISSSSRVQRDALHHVVVVARAIENQLRDLALTDGIRRADHQRVLAALGGEIEAPRPEGVFAEILTELCAHPGLAAVDRRFDAADAVAAIPGEAADGHPPRSDFCAVAMAGDQ